MTQPLLQKVRIEDYNGGLIAIPLVTLMAWEAGARCAVKVKGDPFRVLGPVRRALMTPKGYRTRYIAEHLTACLADVKEQMGLPA